MIELEFLLSKCRNKKIKLVVVESCTGGKILAGLTAIPGSSDVVWGGFVTYSNDSKMKLVKVRSTTLEKYGAVSEETVKEMLSGALEISSANIAVAVSGIAGPGGATSEKPVGTVWIGVGFSPEKNQIKCFHFDGTREIVQKSAVETAYSMINAVIS